MYPTPMHAHYLTVSESRRWAMDNPVGNPYHDFKTKEMPVVAVAVIAYGASMAYAAGTLLSLGGLMMASGALSLAGQLTGNKTLSTLGAVAGVAAAGIGLWQAAGGFSSAGNMAPVETAVSTTGEAANSISGAAANAPLAGTDAALAASNSSVNIGLQNGMSVSPAAADSFSATPLGEAMNAGNAGQMSMAPAGAIGQGQGMTNLLSGGAPGWSEAAAGVSASAPATSLGADIGANGAMSVTGSAPSAAVPVDAAAGGADAGSSINIRTDGGAMQSEAAKAVKEGASYGSDVAGSSGSSSAAGSGDQGLLGSAKKFGEFVIDPKNKDLVTKTMDMGGQMFKAYSEKDLYDAQEELAKAQASGVQANIELARAKVEEVNYSLELAKKRQQNINTRATSAAAQAGAINPNANIFSTAAKPAQGGLIFSGAK